MMNLQLLVLILFCLLFNLGTCLYFPISSFTLTLPVLMKAGSSALLYIYVLDSKDTVSYKMKSNSSSVGLMMANEMKVVKILHNDRQNSTVEAEVVGQEDDDIASMNIRLQLDNTTTDCYNITERICFWDDVTYQVSENRDTQILGVLTSNFFTTLCSSYNVKYNLQNDSDALQIFLESGTWVLSTLGPVQGNTTELRSLVTCTVTAPDGTSYSHEKVLRVKVLPDTQALEKIKVKKDVAYVRQHNLTIESFTNTNKEHVPVAYPESHIKILQDVPQYTRVAQPKHFKHVSGSSSRVTFKLKSSSTAFRITPKGGIIYVYDKSDIVSTNLTVKFIDHSNSKIYETDIKVTVVNDTSFNSCSSVKRRRLCGSAKSQTLCESSCVQNTSDSSVIHGFCQWRQSVDEGTPSRKFSTCSSNLETCPDRFCDPLEQLNPNICALDCSSIENFSGSFINHRHVDGSIIAAGVCTCDLNSKCTCLLGDHNHTTTKAEKKKEEKEVKEEQKEPEKKKTELEEVCGTLCLFTIAGCTAVIIVVISFLWLYKYRKVRKRCPAPRSFKEMTNINYEDYAERPLQPDRPVSNDTLFAELRTEHFDKKWEFPRHKLTVEGSLGEGEFGKVMKGKAEGINGRDGTSIVALKTLKNNARDSELSDLLSEYQLLKEVDHPNVIHLLGACTLGTGPIYIIIEYCEFGSLRNYLRRSRKAGLDNESRYLESIDPITPKDIITFAWQIAKGMAYLTEIKLVHRDLAARNVLLATGKICKISDFGLTRDIYEDDTYLKRSKGRVPVKWMALESLADHIYTTKSDVWSFGIVLWELVTIGASPYPGIAIQNLFHLLKSGYRMEKPTNCSNELYHILRMCWQENPIHRPTFKSLIAKFEEMLGEGKDYLDLNPRIIENPAYFSDFTPEEQSNTDNNEGQLTWNFQSYDKPKNITVTLCASCNQVQCICQVTVKIHGYQNDEVGSYVQPSSNPKPLTNDIPEIKLCIEANNTELSACDW